MEQYAFRKRSMACRLVVCENLMEKSGRLSSEIQEKEGWNCSSGLDEENIDIGEVLLAFYYTKSTQHKKLDRLFSKGFS